MRNGVQEFPSTLQLGGGLAQRQRSGLPTAGSRVRFPVEPKLDSCFILRLIAMVSDCPYQPNWCRNTGRKALITHPPTRNWKLIHESTYCAHFLSQIVNCIKVGFFHMKAFIKCPIVETCVSYLPLTFCSEVNVIFIQGNSLELVTTRFRNMADAISSIQGYGVNKVQVLITEVSGFSRLLNSLQQKQIIKNKLIVIIILLPVQQSVGKNAFR